VVCPAPQYILLHYLINGRLLEESYVTQYVFLDFPYSLCVKRLSFQEELSDM